MTRQFSVIIPTLQRSGRLIPLLKMYCDHDQIAEVIVVNNVPSEIPFDHPKLRILQQSENQYVNPSWNLGVSTANEDLLIISNDDISFSPRVISFASMLLRLPIGIIGCAPDSLRRHGDGRYWAMPTYKRARPFGVLMFMKRDRYFPVPEDLLIWAGDAWLFYKQERLNLTLKGVSIKTEMSTTAASPEFHEMKLTDNRTYYEKYHSFHYSDRYRLGPRLIKTVLGLRRSLRTVLRG